MGSITSSIQLQDNFTNILMNIINAVNTSVSSIEQMQLTMSGTVDTTAIQGIRDQMTQASTAAQALKTALQQVNTSNAGGSNGPAVWQSDNLDVFTNSGIERFRMEVQSTNNLLQQLSSTQDTIARTTYNSVIFPPEAFQNLNSMAVRMDNIRDRIQTIESNPLNMGTDTANRELEQLRAQLIQAVQQQELMNQAVQNSDVQTANEAYLRLSQIISDTERHIRDNTDEQGRFDDAIQQSTDDTGGLIKTISGAVGSVVEMVESSKVKSWIEDCMAAYNTQMKAETQLISGLASSLDTDYVSQFEMDVGVDTTAAVNEINTIQNEAGEIVVPVTAEEKALTTAYDQITAKANEIQGKGIYEYEIMLAGATEFATDFSDADAITMMMDTLSNYAVGMSGGGALESSDMAGYAAELGDIMSGSYDAITEKGFEFTEAQRAIVEGEATREQIASVLGEEYLNMSADMQAAAAISQVINEAWGGLYETMSNTPEGKIIQMNNTWGAMMAVVGKQLYPYVLLFVDAITDNWGTIQTVIDTITLGLQCMLGFFSWLLQGAFDFAQVIVDNWSWISPIIYGIIGALAVYEGYLALAKGKELASAAVKGIMAVWEGIHAAAIWATTKATWAEATSQNVLNAAMCACPIVWLIILIIALIAIFYAAVAAINKFAGTSISATGIICGVFMVAAAFIGNLFIKLINSGIDTFVVLWNFIAAFANFFGNVFNDPVGSIARLFFDLVDCILGLLESLASAVDTIFGSNLAGAVAGWRDSLGGWVDETFGQGEEIMAKMDASSLHLERFEYGAAWDAGYSFGEGIDESIANFDPSSLFGAAEIPSADDYAGALTAGGIGTDIDDISGNTGAMADAMDITSEELKYLRDMAEQEAVNRFTTSQITIAQTNHNMVKSSMDLDGIMSGLTEAMSEAVENTVEGVHM